MSSLSGSDDPDDVEHYSHASTVGPVGVVGLGRAEIQRRALRGTAWTGAQALISVPVAFASNLIIARALHVHGYGVLAFALATFTVATAASNLGVSAGT